VTLLSLLLGLLLATIAALATINYVSQTRALEDLEGRYFALASETVAGQLQSALQPVAPSLNEAVYSASTLGTLPVDDDEAIVDFLLAHMRFANGLTFFYYGAADSGRFVGVRREADGTLIVSRSAPDVAGGRRHEEGVASDGSRFPWPSDLPGRYDARERPWFQAAATGESIAWTGPYQFFTQQELGVTGSRALRGPDGRLVGVFGVDVTIRDLRSLLTSLVRDPAGRAFVLDRGGAIIASSDDSSGTGTPAALNAALVQAPIALGRLPLATPLGFGFEYGGERWLAALQTFPLQGDVEWATAYLIPERTFLQTVYEYQRVALGLGLALVMLAIVLAIRLSRGVAQPLGLLAADLARVGQFELPDRPAPRSRIREVMVLGDAVDRMKASVRSFARYVPAEVVRDLLMRGEDAQLGGALRVLTVQFTDIENFTALSETLTPTQIVTYLSDYLELMTTAAHQHGGTVNQFLGDGIIVLFNAPALVLDHTAQACRAALRAQEALRVAHERWTALGRPALRTRIGLHTGEVLVGTFGTPERFAYTAIGDAMNLASRLEGLNKVYGTWILASADVRKAAGEGLEWRSLDRVAVVGRSGTIEISELLGEKGHVAPHVLEARDRYEAALTLYLAERFETAAAAFRLVAETHPVDRAARLMARRAEVYAQFPPAPDWNGIFVHTTK
jgi:adenylate cyclase